MKQPAGGPRISAVKVHARGQDYRVVRVSGNLFVCSKQGGSCCCGWDEKGRMPFDEALWAEEWERRGIRHRLHLTFTGCLGPCIAGNNAMLQIFGRSIWLKDLNEPELIPAVFNYAEEMLTAGTVLPPPDALTGHVYERYVPPPDPTWTELVPSAPDDADGLGRLDPVCLMDVNPVTAKHTVTFEGRLVAFCAPSCKKQFLAAPDSFMAQLLD